MPILNMEMLMSFFLWNVGARGLQAVLVREMRRGGCAVLLAGRNVAGLLLDLCHHVCVLGPPSRELRQENLLGPLLGVASSEAQRQELLSRSDVLTSGDCVRLVRLARLLSLSQEGDSPQVEWCHVLGALDAIGPFAFT